MELEEDLHYLRIFAAIKWSKGFKCKKKIDGGICRHTKWYEGKKPFSRRCKKCKHLESAIAGTALNGMHMPISTALYMLRELREQPNRLPLIILSKKFNKTPKAIGVFLKRLGKWLPEGLEDYSDDWEKDLKSEKSKNLHARIFGLLYEHDEERPLKEIVYLLVFNIGSTKWHTYYNRMQTFFEKFKLDISTIARLKLTLKKEPAGKSPLKSKSAAKPSMRPKSVAKPPVKSIPATVVIKKVKEVREE